MTWIWITFGALVLLVGHMVAIEVATILARRSVPLPDDRPGWLEKAWRSVRTLWGRL